MHSRRSKPFLLPILISLIIALAPISWKKNIQSSLSEIFWTVRTVKPIQEQQAEKDEEQSLHKFQTALRKREERLEIEQAKITEDHESYPPPIEVLFREGGELLLGSSSLWINIGKKNWKSDLFPIERYCPVLSHGYVIGYIDHVGEKSSRVLLITNPKLFMAVRVKRISSLKEKTLFLAKSFQSSLIAYEKEYSSESIPLQKGVKAMERLLFLLEESIGEGGGGQESNNDLPIYLAYGYLQGVSSSRKSPHLIHGFGFNCDFHRDSSPKRDLRNGKRSPEDSKIAIIKPKDLLETSGLDGIFPKGIPVASVIDVLPLHEGENSYTITAKPLREEFHALHYVTLLPALSQEPRNKADNRIDQILSLLTETSSREESQNISHSD